LSKRLRASIDGPRQSRRMTALPRLPRPSPLPPEMLTLAASQDGAMSIEQLREFASDGTVAYWARSGHLVRLWRGVYALPNQAENLATRLRAADLTLGRPAVACLHTAAALHRFDIFGDGATHVLASESWGSRREGIVAHRRLVTAPVVLVAGRWATDPRETALSIAAQQRRPARILAVLDAALRSGAVTSAEELAAFANRLSLNRIRTVRPLTVWADGRAESPWESWLRWGFLDSGLPMPQPQVWVPTARGNRRRLDLGWEEYKVGCEFDSVEFHTGDALPDDRARHNELMECGWLMVHATKVPGWARPDRVIAQARVALISRGWNPRP
jgi:hypothetical protein